MLESLADVVIQHDSAGRILWCNPLFCELIESKVDDLAGKTLPELGIDIPGLSLRGEKASRVEAAIHTSRGLRWLTWSDVDLPRDDGTTEHYTLARDVTERNQHEATLVRAKEEAEQASLAKSRLLATVSHEIRTPMNGVLGMASLLTFTSLTQEQQTYVQAIATSAQSLISLVNELLDFSKIAAGRLVLEPQPVVVRELIEGVLELMAVEAFDKNLGIAGHISPEVPNSIIADPGRLRQILFNLLGNALRLTERGGVAVSAHCPREETLIISVEDTGPGMDEKMLSLIFKEFEQVDDHRHRAHQGAGLGLAITRRLVVAMGGEIRVTTEPDKGATFFVELPIVGAERTVKKYDAFEGLEVAVLTPHSVEGATLVKSVQARGGQAWALHSEAEALQFIAAGNNRFDAFIADASLEADDAAMLGRLKACGLRARRAFTLIAPKDRPRLPLLRANGYDAFIARPPRGSTLVRLLTGDLPNSSSASDRMSVEVEKPLKRFHVLLAEDNAINALVTRKVIQSAAGTVTTTASGLEAVDILVKTHEAYDLAIVDLSLPDMDGISIIERVRAHERESSLRQLPILVLSADGQAETRQRALEHGATHYAEKPLDPARLLALLGRWQQPPEL